MDPNAPYYTFSTIAQAFAGGFGFLLAVVLYRLADVSEAGSTVGEYLMHYHIIPDKAEENYLRFLARNRQFDAFLARIGPHAVQTRDPDVDPIAAQGLAAEMEGCIAAIRGTRSLLKLATLLSAPTILACLLAIPCVPFMGTRSAVIAEAVAVVAAAACLFVYSRLVLQVARESPTSPPIPPQEARGGPRRLG